MSGNNKGFTVVEIMVVAAVIAIILAIAIPYYTAYKRTACDRVAEQDLMNLLPAWEKYCNDESNPLNEAPYSLSDLAGDFYGWGGTTEACRVRVSYDRESGIVYAASLNGSHPRGAGTYFKYKFLMPATDSNPILSGTPPDAFATVWHNFARVFEPRSAFAKQTTLTATNPEKTSIFVPEEPTPEKATVGASVTPIPANVGFVTEPELASWYPVPSGCGCRYSAHNPETYQYRGCNAMIASVGESSKRSGDSNESPAGSDAAGPKTESEEKSESYLFNTEFTDMDGLSPIYGSRSSSWQIADGKLVATRDKSGEQNIAFGDESWTDYEVETTATLEKVETEDGTKKSPGYGVYYRGTDDDGDGKLTGYRFQYDPCLKKLVVRKVVDGKEQPPFQSVRMKDIVPEEDVYNKKHKISISVKGDHHVIKVDGKKALDFHDDTFKNGKSGFRTWRNSGTWSHSSVKFDSATVKPIKSSEK